MAKEKMVKPTSRLRQTYVHGSSFYGPKDELIPESLDQHIQSGKGKAPMTPKEIEGAAVEGTLFPDGFPGKKELEGEGIETVEQAQGMALADLLAIDGIAEKTAEKIVDFDLDAYKSSLDEGGDLDEE